MELFRRRGTVIILGRLAVTYSCSLRIYINVEIDSLYIESARWNQNLIIKR